MIWLQFCGTLQYKKDGLLIFCIEHYFYLPTSRYDIDETWKSAINMKGGNKKCNGINVSPEWNERL
jgi:hypothetical protein